MSPRYYKLIFCVLTIVVLPVGCRSRQTAQPQNPAPGVADATARFLAGLPGPANGPFQTLEATEAWKNYSTEFDQTWNAAIHELQPVDAFQKRELAPIHAGSDFVFYPF